MWEYCARGRAWQRAGHRRGRRRLTGSAAPSPGRRCRARRRTAQGDARRRSMAGDEVAWRGGRDAVRITARGRQRQQHRRALLHRPRGSGAAHRRQVGSTRCLALSKDCAIGCAPAPYAPVGVRRRRLGRRLTTWRIWRGGLLQIRPPATMGSPASASCAAKSECTSPAPWQRWRFITVMSGGDDIPNPLFST